MSCEGCPTDLQLQFSQRADSAKSNADLVLANERVLFERDLGPTPRVKTYFVALPPTASLRALVRLTHQRWAIEQQYQDLKDELGLDHFEGRSYPGWNRHVLLTALAYTWLQAERRRAGARLPSLPIARAVITEVLTAHFLCHASALLGNHDEIQGFPSADLTKSY